jgi:hypothetical protein
MCRGVNIQSSQALDITAALSLSSNSYCDVYAYFISNADRRLYPASINTMTYTISSLVHGIRCLKLAVHIRQSAGSCGLVSGYLFESGIIYQQHSTILATAASHQTGQSTCQ